MNRFLLIFVLILLFAEFAKAQNPVFLTDKIALQESKTIYRKSAFKESANHATTDFIYQRLEWEIDPAIRYISGKITTTFISKSDNLTKIEFDLNATMEVKSVLRNNTRINFTRNKDKVIVTLPNALNKNEVDSLSIFYKGVPIKSGFGSFTLGTHGVQNTPVLWTLSEPYGAMEWWPCKQSLVDKIDSIDVIVTTPQAYRTASNGVLVSEITNSRQRTMHWKHRHPIATYLVAIAVTNYQSYSDYLELEDDREIEILNYVYPENYETAKTETPVTAQLIELFNGLVGEYPFANEKYGHAQFGWGGGMEHQTMSFMGNFSFGLIAHELAHQWFGDYITLGSWQHIWLNEGFATYLTGIAHEHLRSEWWGPWKESYKNKVLSQPDGSVFVYDTTSVSRIFNSRLSYAKGGFLLHMQRWIFGDEIFFTALQNYFTDENVANGFAYSEDWIRHIETAGDTSLTEFFNDWLYHEGYPIYSINYTQHKPDSLVLKLSQTTSHQSVDFFEMPVPIRVYANNKTDSADFRLNNTHNNQEFILNPGFGVDEIVIDPEDWILCKTDQITGYSIVSSKNELVIYPNPSSGKISFLMANNEACVKSELFSINGSLIRQFPAKQTVIDISDLPPGTYLLRLETTDSVFKEKIIKL